MMIKYLIKLKGIFSFCLLFTLAAAAQTGNDPVLFTVGNDTVKVSEFKYIYEKNNSADKNLYSEKNLREYLDLYTNFKLKVRAAHDAGIDTAQKFIKEYENYRDQLAQPYLTDRQVTQKLIDEAYNHLQSELRVSHILIPVAPDAAPKDTLEAWNTAMTVRNEALKKGADFSALARKYSKDPSVASNGGDLGYFTAFQMIYPFEEGAYKLKDTGEISMPLRTQYGYHVLKLTDKRPNRGEIHVRHILISTTDADPKSKQEIAKSKIDSLYSLLVKGASFTDLAKQYSDHVQSRSSGGELPRFNSFAQYPEKFKDQAFSLKKDGEFTKPFKTEFGWHIVQRIDFKPLQPEKDMEEYLKTRIQKDSRSEKSRDAAVETFKKDYHFTETKKALKKFQKNVDTTLLKGAWKIPSTVSSDKVMFSLDGKKYSEYDFARYLERNQVNGKYKDLKYGLSQYYKDWVNETVFNYQNRNLEKRYPEFRNIANEYKEGIMLFEITDEKVWGKAMQDTLGLKKFFEANKDKYKWKERADAVVFDLRDKTALSDVKKLLLVNKLSPDTIANRYVKKDPLSLNLKQGLFERGDNPLVDKVQWKKGVYEIDSANRHYLVQIKDIRKQEYKKLTEVRGIVVADYQDALEKEWIASLKKKYPVVIHEEVVRSLIK